MYTPAHQPPEVEGAEDGVYASWPMGYFVVALLAKFVHSLCPVGTAAVLVSAKQFVVDETFCSICDNHWRMGLLIGGEGVAVGFLYRCQSCILQVASMTDGVVIGFLGGDTLLLLVVIIITRAAAAKEEDGDDDEGFFHCTESPFDWPVISMVSCCIWVANVS